MEIYKLREILDSPDWVEVRYNDSPVFITEIQPNGVTVNAVFENSDNKRIIPIPIAELTEVEH